MNIYLIEDDEIYAQFVKKALGNSYPKYNISTFTTAEDALKAINGKLPDVMIVDYNYRGCQALIFMKKLNQE